MRLPYVCNTWFQKNSIHKYTWRHPRLKAWHCIDFTIVRQCDRRRCLDAEVKRGAECHTDHHLLKNQTKMALRCFHLKKKRKTERFDVAPL